MWGADLCAATRLSSCQVVQKPTPKVLSMYGLPPGEEDSSRSAWAKGLGCAVKRTNDIKAIHWILGRQNEGV